MVILINFNKHPFKIQYRDGSKALVKAIPSNTFVAMKGLDNSKQITNRKALAKEGITIWDYELNTYYHRNAQTPTGETLPFAFVGNNVKKPLAVGNGYYGTAAISGMTFVADNIHTNTVFSFITTANTAMANATISAATIGNNVYISFSGSAISTANWYAAVLASGIPAGVSITGYNTTRANTNSALYLSASTVDTNSPFAYLQSMV